MNAEQETADSCGLSEPQLQLMKRINRIVTSLMHEFQDTERALSALALNDDALVKLIFNTLSEHRSLVYEREARKQPRSRENLSRFYDSLDASGGTILTGEVADILGISAEQVALRLGKGQLLAFRKNGEDIFPCFLFLEEGLLPGFEQVMAAFDADMHPMLRLSLLRSTFETSPGVHKTAIRIMQDGADEKELALVRRAASLLEQHVAT